ncbi:MAG TPA: DUF4383 domain-containing protein [Allosphingosinicella sp.]|nr:DUF4383 domain-containing protein [Allosphingosinicella sp.]
MSTRTFAMIFGVVFLAVGILGFGVVPSLLQHSSGSGMSGEGMLFGMFHVNALHNIVHILFGLWGLAASRSTSGAVGYFKVVAVLYALLAILGLIPQTRDGFGDGIAHLVLGGYNVWLHLALAVVAAFFGWVNRPATT